MLMVAPTGSTKRAMRRSMRLFSSRHLKVMGSVAELRAEGPCLPSALREGQGLWVALLPARSTAGSRPIAGGGQTEGALRMVQRGTLSECGTAAKPDLPRPRASGTPTRLRPGRDPRQQNACCAPGSVRYTPQSPLTASCEGGVLRPFYR